MNVKTVKYRDGFWGTAAKTAKILRVRNEIIIINERQKLS